MQRFLLAIWCSIVESSPASDGCECSCELNFKFHESSRSHSLCINEFAKFLTFSIVEKNTRLSSSHQPEIIVHTRSPLTLFIIPAAEKHENYFPSMSAKFETFEIRRRRNEVFPTRQQNEEQNFSLSPKNIPIYTTNTVQQSAAMFSSRIKIVGCLSLAPSRTTQPKNTLLLFLVSFHTQHPEEQDCMRARVFVQSFEATLIFHLAELASTVYIDVVGQGRMGNWELCVVFLFSCIIRWFFVFHREWVVRRVRNWNSKRGNNAAGDSYMLCHCTMSCVVCSVENVNLNFLRIRIYKKN